MQSVLPISASHRPEPLANSLTGRVALVVASTGLVALSAHISLPLIFTAVPLTLQTFAVLVVGMLLGPAAGFASMVLYLAEGASGLPVFSPAGPGGIAQLLGPTAGYLFSYPLAAACAGFFTRNLRLSASTFRNGIIGGTLASLPIFLMGAAWLAFLLHLNPPAAFHLAIAPFLLGEVVKVSLAAGIFSSFQRWRLSGI